MGVEEEAVYYLLQRAGPGHRLRSAFTRGSLRGWVYLEAVMDAALVRLLERTPGIIRTRAGLIRQAIDPIECRGLLTMKNSNTNLKEGKWARVRRGLYKGDVGLVVAVKTWGVELLLLPRLCPPIAVSTLKRKRSSIPPTPVLFDPVEFSRTYNIDPKEQRPNCYTAGGFSFEYGLLRKGYDLHSLSATMLEMPSEHIFLYDGSEHPALASIIFPRSREWTFEEGERVVALSCPLNILRLNPTVVGRGTVSALRENHVEIDLDLGEGIKPFLWGRVRKDIKIGNFVTVTTGKDVGKTGWVHRVNHDTVEILDKVVRGSVTGPDTSQVMNVRASTESHALY